MPCHPARIITSSVCMIQNQKENADVRSAGGGGGLTSNGTFYGILLFRKDLLRNSYVYIPGCFSRKEGINVMMARVLRSTHVLVVGDKP